jgi:PPOX class probable F420-dependent enzyme
MSTLTDPMRQLVDERRYAVLATHNADGSIHLTPTWYLFEGGRFYVESLSSDRKARNVVSRPDATIIVEVRRLGSERWVYASGTADIMEGKEARAINARIEQRYLSDAGMADARVGPVFAAATDVTICVTPAVWRAWSLQGLDEQFFDGILGRCPQRWFRPVEV